MSARGALVALGCLLMLAGCGGDDHRAGGSPRGERPGGGGDEEGADVSKLPKTDRIAFLRLGFVAGELGDQAVPVLLKRRRTLRDVHTLRVLRAAVLPLHPRDRRLVRARSVLLRALEDASTQLVRESTARRGARAALAATHSITGLLNDYAGANPAVRALIPD